ncbi:transcriptional regulator/antitoxin MazE [Palleronia sp.]|uniref:transcriptional regulator/antitoxin MazE n=1 Tax=Palleronia sp. TaxID=1940284 RepID=UPI0035C7B6FD
MKTTIRKHSDALVIDMTPEILAALGAREGDTLLVTQGDDGILRISRADPSIAATLDAAEQVMDENGEMLEALARQQR